MTELDKTIDDGSRLTVRVATPECWADLATLWADTNGCDGCWCFNHHIEPGADDVRGDEAREAKRRYLAAGRAGGVLGYLDGLPVGWCAVDLARDIPGHDCVRQLDDASDEGVWFIHCFYVRPEARGRGVARAMLLGTIEWLRRLGATRVEGFPSPPDEEPLFHAFGGPFGLYAEQGFVRVATALGEGYCRVARAP